MLLSTILQLITGHEDSKGMNYIENFVYFIGTAGTAMVISVIFAIFSMGLWRGKRIGETMESVTNSIYPIGMMLLIIGGGGAFKQILIDGGVGDTIKESFKYSYVSVTVCLDYSCSTAYCIGICNGSRYLDDGNYITYCTEFGHECCTCCPGNRRWKSNLFSC